MKYIFPLIAFLVLVGCSTNPYIVPDTTSDNVVMMQIKDNISQPGPTVFSYGWLFWYGPVAVLGMMWGYRNLIKKPIDCIEKEPESLKVEAKVDDKPES
jgi:hypothetical protein